MEYLTSIGIELDEINGNLNSSLSNNDDPQRLQDDASEIWHMALLRTKNQNLGLQAGIRITNMMTGHILETLAANSATVGEALDNLCTYHEISSDGPHPYMTYEKEFAALEVNQLSTDIDTEIFRHTLDCMFAVIITAIRRLSKKEINLIEVHFTWPQPKTVQEYNHLFKSPLYFQSDKNALVFSLSDLKKNIPHADPVFLDALTKYAQKQLRNIKIENAWTKKVEQTLLKLMADRIYDINSTSNELCVSSRTLQERLKKEGTKFQTILNIARKNIAIEHLKNQDVSIAQLALHLGYSEQSAFNHAFKRWTGKTPKQMREP